MPIADADLELNKKLHASDSSYGTSGRKYAAATAQIANSYQADSILDYGCGKGTLKATVQEGSDRIREFDPAIPGKDAPPEPAEMVVCTDVLEHIPKEDVGAVISHIAMLTKKVALFIIATRPAIKVLEDGRNAHLTVESGRFWYERISEVMHVRLLHDEKNEIMIVAVNREHFDHLIAETGRKLHEKREKAAAEAVEAANQP